MRSESRIDLALSESARLKEYVNSLPAGAWERPTACALWNVRDLIAHVILSTRYQMAQVSRGLGGDWSPPEGLPPAGSVNAAAFSDRIHDGTIWVRDALAEKLLEEFNSVNDQFDEMLAGLSTSDLAKPCYDLRGIAPVRTFIDLRVMELVIHGWDLKSRLEPTAQITPASFSALSDVISRMFTWLFWPTIALPAPIRYRFEVADLSPAWWDVVVEGSHARVLPRSDGTTDVTITCDGQTFILFMFGRLRASEASANGLMMTDGDHALVNKLDQWFRGF